MRKKIGEIRKKNITKNLTKPNPKNPIPKTPNLNKPIIHKQSTHSSIILHNKDKRERNYKYERYINNKVLNNCRRPQRRDWCGPITVAEVIHNLLNKEYSIDKVAKMMNWSPEIIVAGRLGTGSVLKGVEACSFHNIKSKILTVKNDQKHWNLLKSYLKSSDKVLYYHEPGHHLLICGYIEEPLIQSEDIWNHQHVGSDDFSERRCWLIKAEHNVKRPDYITQGIMVPVEFNIVCKNVIEKRNSDLVLFYL